MADIKLVPIAIEYNYLGTFQAIRCLSIPDKDLSRARVVHVDPYSSDFNKEGFAVKRESSALNIKGIRNIARIDAAGEIYNDCAQVIFFDDRYNYQVQDDVYVVDYNGKVFRFCVQGLITLVKDRGIRLGNAVVMIGQGEFFRFSFNEIYYDYTFSGPNIYKKELEAAALLTGRTLANPTFLTLDSSSINGSNILIPQGISDAEINDTVGSLVRVISCPDLMASLSCNLQGVALDALKSPKIVYDRFSLTCHSVKNLELPTRLLTAELHRALFALKLDTFYDKTLHLESNIMSIYIDIANAPNLESCIINLVTPNAFYTDDVLSIELHNAPRLKRIDIVNTIGPKVCQISEHSVVYLCLRGITSDVEVNLQIPTSSNNINIHSDKANLVHAKYTREGYTKQMGISFVKLPDQSSYIKVKTV